ncbi:MAG: CoA transferase [Alphaproteobacteria bacterium]|nr:CoA transferase [Alphaproteobacteria bacterium]
MPGPLEGIKVLDLSSVVLGPLASQILGDLGADVIKIEAPEGDTTRYTGPRRSKDMAALFMGLNRNKRSIVLDLKKPAAQEALWRLVGTADVFMHSIRPQKIAKLGFGHEDVLVRNGRIVYAGIHGYRSDGPYAGNPAYDDVIQGQSGSVDLMNRLVGEPRYMPTVMADKTCGLVSAYSIMAALVERERSGSGQFVEIPMYETMVAYNLTEHIYGHAFDPPEDEMGYTRVLTPSRRPYKTSDGYICVLVYTDPQWKSFWQEAGRPEFVDDPRFISLGSRSDNIEELYRLAGEYFAQRTTAEWMPVLDRLEIPYAPIATLEDLLEDQHLSDIEFFKKAEHPTEGNIVMPDIPVQFSRTPAKIDRLQPNFGEHGREILREAGLNEDEIDSALVR